MKMTTIFLSIGNAWLKFINLGKFPGEITDNIQGMSKKKGTLLKLALAKKFKSNSFEISIT